jgi:hypothetical protein
MRSARASRNWAALLSKPLFKGRPHHNYLRYKRQLEPIFTDIFPHWTRSSARTEVYPRVKLPPSVLYDWKTQWEKNSSWRPWNVEVHGMANRIFSDEQEQQLVDIILSEYIGPGKQFTASTFREVSQEFYASLGGNPDEFRWSDHFIANFKSRHRFSSRRFHLRRRSRIGGRFDIEAWKETVNVLLHMCAHHRIINCDETSWKVVPSGLLTWAPVGADSVSVALNASDKDWVTVFDSVTAASDKLLLFIIAKRKNSAC